MIMPSGVQKGTQRQVYAPAGNEFLYTDGWQTNKGGFSLVIQTFERTAKPRFLPVNLYYHFYLCEQYAGLESLKKIYRWLGTQELNWIDVAHYCRMVNDFNSLTMRALSDDASAWAFSGTGHTETIRFDHEAREIDMNRSRGVVGWNHFDNALYVSVTGKEIVIYLTETPPPSLSIVQSTHYLSHPKVSKNSITAQVRLFAHSGHLEFRSPVTPTASINAHPQPLQKKRFILSSELSLR
jgi:hypothetical protein